MSSLRTLHRAALVPSRTYIQCTRNYAAASPASLVEDGSANKKVIFSGIQPTGIPHLGNYLGALQQWVELQRNSSPDTTLLFSVVDLHAITIRQDPSELAKRRKEMLASLIAVGLDPKRCIIFAQSSVKQHAELMWMLSCGASMGYLSRMTQWKSKMSLPATASPLDPSSTSKDALKLGLFSYPVLQAADILLYNTTHVPVGEDQAQHLEFTRELAIGFNHLYADEEPILIVPQTLLGPAKRVMSLKEPTKKMSKSDPNPRSRILITDTKEEIESKIKGALTDSMTGISYDPKNRPGVANLLELMTHCHKACTLSASSAESDDSSGHDRPSLDKLASLKPEHLANNLCDAGANMKYLKAKAAQKVNAVVEPIRERYEELISGNQKELENIAEEGAIRAETLAEATMERVRAAMGMKW